MNTIYRNADTGVMVMPAGSLDLRKVAALDHGIKTVRNINGTDVVSCRRYGTGSAVLADIDHDPEATDSRVVQCRHKGDRTEFPSVPPEGAVYIEEGHTLPEEVESLFRACQE